MHLSTNPPNSANAWRPGFVATLLAGLLCLLLVPAWHSTAKVAAKPKSTAGLQAAPLLVSMPPFDLHNSPIVTQTSLFTPLLTVIPGQDGQELFISAGNVDEVNGMVFANLDIGPAHKKGSYAMVYSDTVQSYLTTALGFSAGQDEGGTLSLTTTLGLATENIELQRAFIQTSQPETVVVDSNRFIVEMPNLGTVPVDIYLVVMSTNASPGPLPAGYNLVGKPYAMRPSGSLTQSEKFMTLKLGYYEPLPTGSDAHTLAVMGWNPNSQAWETLEGDLFDDNNCLAFSTKTFGLYALVAAPTWRDSFKEFSLTGVAARSSTEWGPGDAIILSSGAATGTVTSISIVPAGDAAEWGILSFNITTPPGTGITVDVLDNANNVILGNVLSGTNLTQAGLDLAAYPNLKLRATLTSPGAGATPALLEWSLGWSVTERQVYLPLVMK